MKFKRLWLLLAFVAFPSFAQYQQQWFSQFQSLDGNIDFVCTGQCFALIGPVAWSDYALFRGTLQGEGVVGYGFLVGQQIVPGETVQVNGETSVNQQFSFNALSFYAQLPAEAQLVLIAQGNVTGMSVWLEAWFMTFYNKIGQWWKDFWKMEPLTPYSINLRYGAKILWTSIVQYGYWIFFFVALYLLFFAKWNKEKKYRSIFFLGIGIFLFIGMRNIITYTSIVDQWLNSYTNQSLDDKTFFDLWDYIVFTDKIRKTLDLDAGKKDCTIFVDSFQDRPFKAHWESVYLKPCTLTLTWSEADYLLYYRKPVATWDAQKSVLVEFHWNYLLLNK